MCFAHHPVKLTVKAAITIQTTVFCVFATVGIVDSSGALAPEEFTLLVELGMYSEALLK